MDHETDSGDHENHHGTQRIEKKPQSAVKSTSPESVLDARPANQVYLMTSWARLSMPCS